MSKALDLIVSLRDKLEENWRSELIRINLWNNVVSLYEEFPDKYLKPNIILSYIIYAYDKDSDWLEMDMDRVMNKERIMKSLAGPDFKDDLNYVSAIVGELDPYNAIIEKYLNDQPDKRYVAMMASYEFHSRTLMMANQKQSSPSDMASMGKVLEVGDARFDYAEGLKATISQENVLIDTNLKKEGRKPLTERATINFDYMSWEARLLARNQKKKADNKKEKSTKFDDDDEYEDEEA